MESFRPDSPAVVAGAATVAFVSFVVVPAEVGGASVADTEARSSRFFSAKMEMNRFSRSSQKGRIVLDGLISSNGVVRDAEFLREVGSSQK